MKQLNKVLLFLFVSITLIGCGNNTTNPTTKPEKSNIENIVSDFYQSDYEYKKTIKTGDEETIIQGKIIQSPYKEYQKIMNSSSQNVWEESYYYNQEDTLQAIVKTDNKWVKANAQRIFPQGYGETITYSYETQERIDGKDVEIYNANYKVDIGKKLKIQEPLEAVVNQQYYIDKEEQVLLKIVTDLTDFNQKIAIGNDISSNNSTLEEAENNVKNQNIETVKEILEISNYGKEIKIDIPDTNV